ncbi:hypothetical protein MKW92_018739, partial [Papaver armeniacum]
MEHPVYQVFKAFRTVSDLWDGLNDRYANPKLLNYRKYQVYCEFTQIKQGKGQSVDEYHSKFIALWNELKSLYEDAFDSQGERLAKAKKRYGQETEVFQFLWGLRAEFEYVRITALDMNPLPLLSKVCCLARDYESLLNLSKSSDKHGSGMLSSAAMWRLLHDQGPHEDGKIGNGCTYCGHTNHK